MRAWMLAACCAGALACGGAFGDDLQRYRLKVDSEPYRLRADLRGPQDGSASAGSSAPAAEDPDYRRRVSDLERHQQDLLRLRASLEALERDLQMERRELARLRSNLSWECRSFIPPAGGQTLYSDPRGPGRTCGFP
jgi:hypothetical protein